MLRPVRSPQYGAQPDLPGIGRDACGPVTVVGESNLPRHQAGKSPRKQHRQLGSRLLCTTWRPQAFSRESSSEPGSGAGGSAACGPGRSTGQRGLRSLHVGCSDALPFVDSCMHRLRGGAGSAADREEQCHHQERPGGRGHLEPIHHAVRAKGGDGWRF